MKYKNMKKQQINIIKTDKYGEDIIVKEQVITTLDSKKINSIKVKKIIKLSDEYIKNEELIDNIKESILEKSAKKTVSIVRKKTLKNSIIFEYIFLEFYNNLKYYIYSIYSPIKENKTISAEENKKET